MAWYDSTHTYIYMYIIFTWFHLLIVCFVIFLFIGGLLAPSNGVIYGFPAHSNVVLCVDTNPTTNDDHNRVSTIPIEKGPLDNDPDDLQYKWLGGSYGADGCIYGMPRYVHTCGWIGSFRKN